jgi:hypothetical protein
MPRPSLPLDPVRQLHSRSESRFDKITPSQLYTERSAFLGSTEMCNQFPRPLTSFSNGSDPTSVVTNRRVAFLNGSLRPNSAPMEEPKDDFRNWLPPKRHLPFPRSRTASRSSNLATEYSDNDSCGTEPAVPRVPINRQLQSMTKDLDSNRGPFYCKPKSGSRPTQLRAAEGTASVTKSANCQVANIERQDNLRESESSTVYGRIEDVSPVAVAGSAVAAIYAPLTPSLQTNAASSKRISELIEEEETSRLTKRIKMVDAGCQTQTSSGRQHTAGMRKSVVEITTAAHQDLTSTKDKNPQSQSVGAEDVHKETHSMQCLPPEGLPSTVLAQIDEFISSHRARPAPREVWESPGWASITQENRHDMLNDFICDNLTNDGFLQLCKDMEIAWRRIALDP